MEQGRLSWRIKIGYGMGHLAPSTPYNLLLIYFVLFLTIAGVAPATAGLIGAIAVLWDAIINPFIGSLSDNYVTQKGRRLPWMKLSLIPMAILVYLMFAPFTFPSAGLQVFYYLLVGCLAWTTYSTFVVPYYAMAAELTENYGERNNLRLTAMIGGYICVLLALSGPAWIIEAGAVGDGMEWLNRGSWGTIGIVFGIFALITGIVTLLMLSGSEKEAIKMALEAKKEKVKLNFANEWTACLKIKTFRRVLLWTVVYVLGLSTLTTVFVFLLTFNANMTAAEQGAFWIIYNLAIIAALPVITFFANKFGKKPAMLGAFIPMTIISLYYYFAGVNNIVDAYIFGILWGIVVGVYYTFYVAKAYDCVEISELLTGNRQEGAMVALTLFVMKIAMAIGIYVTGIVLDLTGYDATAAVQIDSAVHGILALAALIPAIFTGLSVIVLIFYPVSKKKFELLCEAVEKKRAGQEYSTEGFEDIL